MFEYKNVYKCNMYFSTLHLHTYNNPTIFTLTPKTVIKITVFLTLMKM